MINNNINKEFTKSNTTFTAIFVGYKPTIGAASVDMHFRNIYNNRGIFIKKDLFIDCREVSNAVAKLALGKPVKFHAKLIVDATDKVEGNTFKDIVIFVDKNNN